MNAVKTADKHRSPVSDRRPSPHQIIARFAVKREPGVIIAGTIMTVFLLACTFRADQAFAAGSHASGKVAVTPSANATFCKPLLEITRGAHISESNPASMPSSSDARKAIAISFLLGVNQITGPRETGLQKKNPAFPLRPDIETTGADTGQAMAITAYRRCVSQRMLDAHNTMINKWRWTR